MLLITFCISLAALTEMTGNFGENEKTQRKQAPMQLKIALQNEETHPLCRGMQKFATRLEELSGGQMELELHYSAELGDPKEVIEQVQSGSVDGTMLSAGIVSELCKDLGVFSMPYLFDSVEHARYFEQSAEGEKLFRSVQESGSKMVCVGVYQEDARNYFFTKKLVRNPENLKGLRLRVQDGEIYRATAEALGAEPEEIDFSNLYSALVSGVADGAEQPVSGFVVNHYETICSYYLLDEHEFNPNLILFSEAAWTQLSEQQKAWIKQAFSESVAVFEQVSDRQAVAYLEEMKKNGVNVISVDRTAWQAAVRPVYQAYEADFSELIEEIRKTRPEEEK